MGRTDLIIDYQGKQYIIEMKIWYGNEYNARGEEQLLGYLNDYYLERGCMLSFNFNKNKKPGVQEISFFRQLAQICRFLCIKPCSGLMFVNLATIKSRNFFMHIVASYRNEWYMS